MAASRARVSVTGEQKGFYLPPDETSKWQTFKNFLYNPKKGEVFGRTASSWGKIGLFYLIFYCVLASMFGIMLWIFYHTLDPRVPRWTLSESLIGKHPGLGFRPMPNDSDTKSTLIWYRGKEGRTFELWTRTLEQFLEVYRRPGLTPGRGQNIYNCDYDRPPGRGQVCDVDVKNWFPCTSENKFNYHHSGPCVFLKLNKIYGWQPDFYNDTVNLPKTMPEDLKNHIATQKSINPLLLNTIWVTCEGENSVDKENMGEIRYIPRQGFPGYFYPYINTEGYLSPLIAIHFKRPKRNNFSHRWCDNSVSQKRTSTTVNFNKNDVSAPNNRESSSANVIINVECKAWAKNIRHDRKDKIGVVHFELLID